MAGAGTFATGTGRRVASTPSPRHGVRLIYRGGKPPGQLDPNAASFQCGVGQTRERTKMVSEDRRWMDRWSADVAAEAYMPLTVSDVERLAKAGVPGDRKSVV